MTASKSTAEQAGRDARGRFRAGRSGNPAGRPPGASCRAVRMAREWAETKGLPLLMKAAEEGDMDATRLLVTLAVPRQKPVSLPEPVPSFPADKNLLEQGKAIMAAVTKGTMRLDTARGCMELLGVLARLDENLNLAERLEALEAAWKCRRDDGWG